MQDGIIARIAMRLTNGGAVAIVTVQVTDNGFNYPHVRTHTCATLQLNW